MTTGKLSIYPSFVRCDKTSTFRRQRIAAYLLAAVAVGAAAVFIKGCAPGFIPAQAALLSPPPFSSSDGPGFGGFVIMVAAGFVAKVLFSREGGAAHVQRFPSAVISEHLGVVDPGSHWRGWPLSWAGGRGGVSTSTLFVYSFDRDSIVTIPLTEVAAISLGQRQVAAASQFLGGAVVTGFAGVGGGTVPPPFLVAWVIDVDLTSADQAHLPLNFAHNEKIAKELYGQLRPRGGLCA